MTEGIPGFTPVRRGRARGGADRFLPADGSGPCGEPPRFPAVTRGHESGDALTRRCRRVRCCREARKGRRRGAARGLAVRPSGPNGIIADASMPFPSPVTSG